MKWKIVAYVLMQALRALDEDKAKEAIDDFIDKFEDSNEVVKSLCVKMRAIIGIPDDIGGDED